MMGKLRFFIDLVKRVYAKSSNERYVAYIRKHGVTVGDNVIMLCFGVLEQPKSI